MFMNRSPCFVLYIGPHDRAKCLDLTLPEWEIEVFEGPCGISALTRRPDIVLIDPFADSDDGSALDVARADNWMKQLTCMAISYPPPVCALVPEGTSQDIRVDLMDIGIDDGLQWPVSSRMLRAMVNLYGQKKSITQALDSKQAALDKSFAYLDRFKQEMGTAKKQLAAERKSLNAALKQNQQMILERRRMKSVQADLKTSLEENMDGFGKVLHTLIEHRVEYNRGHGRRVAEIATFIGKDMGFDEKKLEDLRKAGMLHEIGLLFLADAPYQQSSIQAAKFIAKNEDFGMPDHQTDYDRTLMVQYPVKGAELLKQCPGFESAAKIISQLNENADGTGFPDGLKRRYISMASKILAGADALDTLRETPGITSTDDILIGLERLSGARLEPVIVGQLEKYVVTHLGPDDFRVRGVGIEQLVPGMVLATALFTASGTKLFTANTRLTKYFIEKIIQYHREYPVDTTVYIKV